MTRTKQGLLIAIGLVAWLTYLIMASAVMNEPEHHWTRRREIYN